MPAQTAPHAAITAEELASGAAVENVAKESITTEKIAAKAVGSAQVKIEGIAFANVEHTTAAFVPAKPAEKAEAKGTRFVLRQILVAFGAEAAQVKFKLKHELTSLAATCVSAWSAASEKPSKSLAIKEQTILSNEEIEVELSAAPGAVEVFFLIVG